MEPEGSLTHSQVPATCLYPQPARSSPYTHIPLPEPNQMSLFSLFKLYQSIIPGPRQMFVLRNKASFFMVRSC